MHLFKKKRIDYISLAKKRIAEAQECQADPLFRDMQPSARKIRSNPDGFDDVDQILAAKDAS